MGVYRDEDHPKVLHTYRLLDRSPPNWRTIILPTFLGARLPNFKTIFSDLYKK